MRYTSKTGMFQVQVNFKEAAHLIHKYGGLVTVYMPVLNQIVLMRNENMKAKPKTCQ